METTQNVMFIIFILDNLKYILIILKANFFRIQGIKGQKTSHIRILG